MKNSNNSNGKNPFLESLRKRNAAYIERRDQNLLDLEEKRLLAEKQAWLLAEKKQALAPTIYGGPSREGSSSCRSGSLASGGNRSYCACDTCF